MRENPGVNLVLTLAMSKPIYVLNGPNLNLLGSREPEVYGRETLDDIRARCERKAASFGLTIDFRQSNHEGELVAWIQEAKDKAAGMIVNAGAFTHSSIAMLDALLAADMPCIEVHLSNIFRRESFRHHSYISKGAKGVICGFGPLGYELAIEGLAASIAAEKAR
jgi:3-dehydroquinate dehydratase-2